MRVMITGSRGFVGEALTEYLSKSCNHFVGMFDLKDGMDITDIDKIRLFFNHFKPQVVYHLAGQVDVGYGEKNPQKDLDINAKGTYNLLQVMAENKVHVIVFTSSDAAAETMTNYGVSKLTAEKYVLKFTMNNEVQGKIARFSSVYGPRRIRDGKQQGPVNNFLYQGITKQPITVFGSGESTRSFSYISDTVRALELIQRDGHIGQIYNVGSGVLHTINMVAHIAKQLTGAEIVKENVEGAFVSGTNFDCTNLARLGFTPQYDLYTGMCMTKALMEWELTHPKDINTPTAS